MTKMNIVLFSHPYFTVHQSMTRFTAMLKKGMEKRGHKTEIWYPREIFFCLPFPKVLKKWMGYIDQYIIFPIEVQRRMEACSKDTLFVFTDQSLGPWVPLVLNRPHVIHCHDFLAQFSALGRIKENKTGWTGRQYQCYIRKGYSKGKNFISVSKKTQNDLHKFVSPDTIHSNLVYNGLNNSFYPSDISEARLLVGNLSGITLSGGYLLHVGGNQWYKNRFGLIDLYEAWRHEYESELPLIMIGEYPSFQLKEKASKSLFNEDIHFLYGIEDKFIRLAYTGATIFLFPSIAEGFGWPIAEAMACGCPVITTNKAPMTEVAGDAGFFISGRPEEALAIKTWAWDSAKVINKVLQLSHEERDAVVKAGLENAKRFDTETALDQIEKVYLHILKLKELI